MELGNIAKFKWILILEALLAGAYIALTRGLFIIYLSSLEYQLEEISLLIFVSATASLLVSVLLYKHISFVLKKVKSKLIFFHGFERIIWLFMPLATTGLLVTGLFTIFAILSSLIGVFLVFAIYGSLQEMDIRDVTAKRAATSGVSSIIGFVVAIFLLALLPEETKFAFIFSLGAIIGLLSTALLFFIDLKSLDTTKLPQATDQPEKIFSTSSFFIVLMASGNLVGIVWIPFVMTQLAGPDWLAATMSLAATFSSIVASLFWKRSSFKTLRIILAVNILGPLLILATPWPEPHIAINAFTAFTFTGANFIGVFLFAKYTKWFGAAKSSILLVILGNLAQMVAAPLGILSMGNYTLALMLIFGIKVAATIMAFLTIPEVAVVSEDVANTYSQVVYSNSVLGYKIGIDISKKTIVNILRILALSTVLAVLYIIYRILWLLLL
jgi:hypothetical protein